MALPSSPDDLTPEWLGDTLADAAAFCDAKIRSVTHSVIGEGFGLDGTVARLDLETNNTEAPASIVAKFAKAKRGGGGGAICRACLEARFPFAPTPP